MYNIITLVKIVKQKIPKKSNNIYLVKKTITCF